MNKLMYWLPGVKAAEEAAFKAGWDCRANWMNKGETEWYDIDPKYQEYFFKYAVQLAPASNKPIKVEVVKND